MIGPGKRWEHIPLTRNGKPIRQRMHVKKGDTVVIVSGDDKGEVSNVMSVYPKTGRIKVQGANIVTRYTKPTLEGESGKLNTLEGVIHHSNVMHWSANNKVRSRVGYKITDKVKVR